MLVQLRGSRPAAPGSRFPLTVRHDDVTFQAPTTSPPHGVTLVAPEQDAPPLPPVPVAPPLAELPPVPLFPPLLELPPVPAPPLPTTPPLSEDDPPLPEEPPLPEDPPAFVLPPEEVAGPGLELQAPSIDTSATPVARKTDWSFITRLLSFGGTRIAGGEIGRA